LSDVFISYKREDRAAAETLASLLADLNVDPWFDAGIEVSAEWTTRIIEQLARARAILVCWTPTSTHSSWVRKEARVGLERGNLISLKLVDCEIPQQFTHLQAADLRGWRGEADHAGLQGVLTQLDKLLDRRDIARNARLRAGGQAGELVELLRHLLIERARAGAPPITYGEAERAIRVAAVEQGLQLGEFNQISLWGALDAIAEQNRNRREPPLRVLIVSKETGRPGRGYWQKHVFLAGDGDELEQAVFDRQVARVHEYEWPQDN